MKTKLQLFDTHAHYDDNRFDEMKYELLDEIQNPTSVCPPGVGYILNVGCNLNSSKSSINLAEKYEFIYAAVGLHPHDANTAVGDWIEQIKEMLSHSKVRAIGEVGLDFHYDFSPRSIQEKVFEEQLILSEKVGYPIVVHDREAHGKTMELISRHSAIGIMHSYSGSGEMAKELVKHGWYISYSGSITFKNAVNLTETVQYVPDDRLLLETDSPFLAPVPYRGNINTSRYTYAIAQKLAELRSDTIEHIIKITTNNAKRLFKII